ncbi:hypothetical protein ACFE04_027372 [Oxalis oulophora]
MAQPQRIRRRTSFVQDYRETNATSFKRSISFTNRLSTLKSKAEELSILCDIPICLVCFEYDGTPHSWPNNVRETISNLRKLPMKIFDLHAVLKIRKAGLQGKKKALASKEFETLMEGWIQKKDTLSMAELASYASYLDNKLDGLMFTKSKRFELMIKQKEEDKRKGKELIIKLEKEDGFRSSNHEINNVGLLPKVEVNPNPKAINSYIGGCSQSNYQNHQSNYGVASRGLASCSTSGVSTVPGPKETGVFGNSNSNNPNDNCPDNIIPNNSIMQINETILNPVVGRDLNFPSGYSTEFSQIGGMGYCDALGYPKVPNYKNNDTLVPNRIHNFGFGIPENFELTNSSSRFTQGNMGYGGAYSYDMGDFQNCHNLTRSNNGPILQPGDNVYNSQELNWLNLLSSNQQINHMGLENLGWMGSTENAMMPVLGRQLNFSSGFPTEFSHIGGMENYDKWGYPNYRNANALIPNANPNFGIRIPENLELTNPSSRFTQSNMGYGGSDNYDMRGFQNSNNLMSSDNGTILQPDIIYNSHELARLQNAQRNNIAAQNLRTNTYRGNN